MSGTLTDSEPAVDARWSPARFVRSRTATDWFEYAILIGIVAVFLLQSILILRHGAPLGHDESVYSLRARDLVRGQDPAFYWLAYRAPGLPLFLTPLWLLRATEPYLRAAVAGFGALLLVSTWWLGRTMFGRRAGLIAAAGLAFSPVILGASTQVWPDVPGAALGLTVLAWYAWALSRSRFTSWTVAGLVILTGLATLTRFGAPVPLAAGLVVLTLWQYENARVAWKEVLATAVLASVVVIAILAVPATTVWAQSTSYTPAVSPLSAIAALEARNAFPWTRGFIDFWEMRDPLIGGRVAGLLLGFGLISAVLGAAQRSIPARALAASIAGTVLTASAIAYLLHGELRYLSPAYPWLWITAAAGLAYLSRFWAWPTTITLGLFVFFWGLLSAYPEALVQTNANIANFSEIKTASVAIDADSPDFECSAIGSYTPQVGWYSKCSTFGFNRNRIVVSRPTLPDGPRYMMLVYRGKRQPEGELLDGYLMYTTGLLIATGDPDLGPRRYVEVYRMLPDG